MFSGPHFSKPTHSYGEPFGECEETAVDDLDSALSCPCGRGDYEACKDCPYETCSVHGDKDWAGKGYQEPEANAR